MRVALPVVPCQCDLIAKVRAQYVNANCVWGQGDCAAHCPSCRQLDALIAERSAGYREGRKDMLTECTAAMTKAISDRSHDLYTCNRDDDCTVKAMGADLALDDALVALSGLERQS